MYALNNNASARGDKISGNTLEPIVNIDDENSMSESEPISENRKGANIATDILLIREYVASSVIEPPSKPVITGAAVAVGQNMHINAPWAISLLNGAITKYAITAPMI